MGKNANGYRISFGRGENILKLNCDDVWTVPWIYKKKKLDCSMFIFFGCATQLVGSQFPNQGLNPGQSSEIPES